MDQLDWRIGIILLLAIGWKFPNTLRWVLFSCLMYPFLAVVARYYSFSINAFDISIFDHMLLDGQMRSTLCDCHHFSIHPQFLLIPISMLYRWMAHPIVLQLVHAFCFVGTVGMIFKDQASRQPWVRALIVAAFTFQHFSLSILHYGFHPEIFYLPIGWKFLKATEEERDHRWWWILFLLIKEDAGLYAAAYLMFATRRGSRTQALLSLLVCLASILVIKPLFGVGDHDYFVRFWGEFGTDAKSVAIGMVSDPWKVVQHIARSEGAWKLFVYTGLCPLFLPWRYAAPLIVGSAIHLTAHRESALSRFGLYYFAPMMPFLWFGLLRQLDHWSTSYQRFVFVMMMVTGTPARLPVPDLLALKRLRQWDQAKQSYVVQSSLYPHFRQSRVQLWTSLDQCQPGTTLIVDPKSSAFPLVDRTLSGDCTILDLRAGSSTEKNHDH